MSLMNRSFLVKHLLEIAICRFTNQKYQNQNSRQFRIRDYKLIFI